MCVCVLTFLFPKDLGILSVYNIHLLGKYIMYIRFLFILYVCLESMYCQCAYTSIHLFIKHRVNCRILELEGTYADILFRTPNLEKRNLGS